MKRTAKQGVPFDAAMAKAGTPVICNGQRGKFLKVGESSGLNIVQFQSGIHYLPDAELTMAVGEVHPMPYNPIARPWQVGCGR